MAAAAATVAATSLSLSSLHISSTLKSSRSLQRVSLVRASASPPLTSSPHREFNISFGAGTNKQNLNSSSDNARFPGRLLIPWIVRDEDGNFKLSSTPPARFIHEMAITKPAKTSAKKNKESKGVHSSSEPKHSKAARRFYNENFREPQRLSKVLAAAGVASRRSSEELIFDGQVTVNGSICKAPQTRVDLCKDIIYVKGSRLPKKLPPKLYFALNKPKGYICSSGEKESKCVTSLFDDYWKTWNKTNRGLPKPRLFTVGRLDVATTGLIIVTNDGDFAQRVAHPSSGLSKEYIAAIEGSVSKRQLTAVSEGVEIDGVHCMPETVELLPAQPDISRPRLRIVVQEGRNHEVRELVKNAGLQLHSLKRVRIGGFRLPSDLGLGQYLELRPADIKSFGGKVQSV
ncbi:putative ribosomal large subunit pseudouridine synthase SVR1, chloroplastic [Aristolochia californica]|uniref:putative ribosomal large subunit pseudouridine synthase SVR1, chloroplastic n=1 Tax=Aristolochia californica TaxID=171875 RepID=UPI0035DBF4AC